VNALLRELRLLARDRAAVLLLAAAGLAAALAVASGLAEVRQQRADLTALVDADRRERAAVATQQADWGSAAYYSFHLTWAPPSRFAFAALGLREHGPWQHRVRMLALEGQIHEPDAGQPEVALVGRFDYAFVAATLAPLLAILLLHGLAAGERAAGRHDLLLATAHAGTRLWLTRAGLRLGLLALALLLPLAIGAVLEGAPASVLLAAAVAVVAHLLFWALLCRVLDRGGTTPASTQLMQGVGAWLVLAVIAPAAIAAIAERRHPLPEGAAILLAQREAVNRAWDLPKDATMRAFVASHPQWAAHAGVSRPFEWKWYFAFQQVGDEAAAALSQAHREARAARSRTAATLAWFAPPAALQRRLEVLAGTDAGAMLAYEARVRGFHAALREWYYPHLFRETPFDAAALEGRPEFTPAEN
jgi:ABC-2 type transport system permease protein